MKSKIVLIVIKYTTGKNNDISGENISFTQRNLIYYLIHTYCIRISQFRESIWQKWRNMFKGVKTDAVKLGSHAPRNYLFDLALKVHTS